MSDDIPLFIGPFKTWRIWRIKRSWRDGRYYLASLYPPINHRILWKKPLPAKCLSREVDVFVPTEITFWLIEKAKQLIRPSYHPVPEKECRCGYYSHKKFPHALREFSSMWREYEEGRKHPVIAVGLTSIWGRTVEGTEGYRSQFAWPREVWVPIWSSANRSWDKILTDLRNHYEIPVYPIPVDVSDIDFSESIDEIAKFIQFEMGPASANKF